MFFVKARYSNGIIADIPFGEYDIYSPLSNLYSINNYRLNLNPALITSLTQIVISFKVKSMVSTSTLEIFPLLSPSVIMNVEVITPSIPSEKIYMVGDINTLGGWSPANGLVLTGKKGLNSIGKKTYTGSFNVERNALVSFKFCADTNWIYAECQMDGTSTPNRVYKAGQSTNIYKGEVKNWRTFPQ